jgi:outer membrane protein assembly factor BamB
MPNEAKTKSAQNSSVPPRLRRSSIVFAVILPAIFIAILLAIRLAPDDYLKSDYKNFYSYICVFLGVVLIGGWFWLSSGIVWYWKAILPIGLVGILVSFSRVTDSTGDFRLEFGCRFTKDPDELLAPPKVSADAKEVDLTQAKVEATRNDYPRFLGADGRATVTGIELTTDWDETPPRELWRNKIGAGWSAFSIVGDYAVTQEQRGKLEYVVCYDLLTGETLWVHSDKGRHNDALGGVGPCATPTIDEGRVYTQGAFGMLNCLNGKTGKVIWSKNIIKDHKADYITWGRSGSPLVVKNKVIVSAGGPGGNSLVAYDKLTGGVIWNAGNDRAAYGSPVYAVLGGVPQVLTINEGWLRGHRASDGEILWSYAWPSNSDATSSTSNPVVLDGSFVFLSKGYGHGCAMIAVQRDADEFRVKVVQRSGRLMHTKMTNVVVSGDYIFGLSGGILECIRIDKPTVEQMIRDEFRPTDFKRMWKGGRYGHGQIMVAGQVILVVTEEGELVLVEMTPDRHRELADYQALDGKTWNNPALSGKYLLVRNHLEAACFELPLIQSPDSDQK